MLLLKWYSSFAMGAVRADAEVVIEDCANVATSFPNFLALAQEVGLTISPA